MRQPALLLLIAVLLTAPASAQAGRFDLKAWRAGRSDWAGFGVGTQVVRRRTTTLRVLGLPRSGPLVIEERRTLTDISSAALTVHVERKAAGVWLPGLNESIDLRPPLTSVALKPTRQDEVSIGGKAYACSVYVDLGRTLAGRQEKATLWVHPTHGILRFVGVRSVHSGASVRWRVTELGLIRKVGDLTLDAREITLEGGNVTGTLIMSADVPGGIIEQALKVTLGASSSTVRERIIAFTRR